MNKQDAIELILLGWSNGAICMYSQHTNNPWSISDLMSLRKDCKKVVDIPS